MTLEPDLEEACTLLEWDSSFFSKRIAMVKGNCLRRAELTRIREWARRNLIDCLYYQVDPQCDYATREAGVAGFYLVDVRVTLACSKLERRAVGSIAREANLGDLSRLKVIAAYSHRDTRFHFDENLQFRGDALYTAWIERSLLDGLADAVLVVDGVDRAAGYVTCKMVAGARGSIGLLAVAREARGSGNGAALIEAALGWLGEHGAQTVSVVTQARNLPAQRLYQRCGFVTSDVMLWYHAWPLLDDLAGEPRSGTTEPVSA